MVRTGAAGIVLLAGLVLAQQSPFVFHTGTQTVLVNLTVRDRQGNFVRGLKASDFSVFEDGKPQSITGFDFETMITAPAPSAAASPVSGAAGLRRYANRRLIVLDLDLTTMPPENVEAAIEAARHYLDRQMQPADMVAIAVLAQGLDFAGNFTDDRAALERQLDGINPTAGEGFTGEQQNADVYEGPRSARDLAIPPDVMQVLDADRSYLAIQAICRSVALIPQKKSLVFFSDGINILGQQDSLPMRLAISAAQRANVSLYTLDVRGMPLPAQPALMTAQQQEPLATLAVSTGGQALLDTNDFAPIFQRVQGDDADSYLLTYESPNHLQDGAYRHIGVRTSLPGVKLEYRQGYYADQDFAHLDSDDRHAELTAQLAADQPDTSLPVQVTATSTPERGGRYRVTLHVTFPPGAIAAGTPGVDVEGLLRQATLDRPWTASLHATLRPSAQPWGYTANYEVPAGTYALRLAVREDRSGAMGTVRTIFQVPDSH